MASDRTLWPDRKEKINPLIREIFININHMPSPTLRAKDSVVTKTGRPTLSWSMHPQEEYEGKQQTNKTDHYRL